MAKLSTFEMSGRASRQIRVILNSVFQMMAARPGKQTGLRRTFELAASDGFGPLESASSTQGRWRISQICCLAPAPAEVRTNSCDQNRSGRIRDSKF